MIDYNPNSEYEKKLKESGIKKKDTIFDTMSPSAQAKRTIQNVAEKNNNTMGVDIKSVKNQPKAETLPDNNAIQLGTKVNTTSSNSVDDFLSSSTSNIFGAQDSFSELLKEKGYENQFKPIDWSVKPKKNEYQWRPKYEPKEIESQSGPRFEAKQSEPEIEKDSTGLWFLKQAWRGVANANDNWATELNYMMPTESYFREKDPFVWVDNYYSGINNYVSQEAEKSSLSRGKGWDTAGDVISGLVSFVPDLSLALMTRGRSMVGKGLPSIISGSKVVGPGASIIKEIFDYAKENPQNVISYIKDLNDAYGSAKEQGATDFEAALSSAAKSAANIGLDAINLPDGQNGELVDIIFDVAKDIDKGVINKGIDKLILDDDKEVLSTDDEDAVFNQSNIGSDFLESISSSIISNIIDSLPDSYKISNQKAKQMTDEEFDDYIKNILEMGN